MPRHVAALACAIAFVAACSVSLDGYSGGGPVRDGGVADEAGFDASAAKPPEDGGDDAGRLDGGNIDAGMDAGVLDCTGTYLCDDFERASGLGSWEHQYTDATSSLVYTTDHAYTGQSSLRASVGKAVNANAALVKTISASSQIDITFALFLESQLAGLNLMTMLWQAGKPFTQLYMSFDGSDVAMVEQGFDASGTQYTFNASSQAAIQTNIWVPVSLHIDFAGKTYSAKVGDSVLANAKPLTANYPNDVSTFQAGSGYSSGSAVNVVDIDAVRITLTP